MHCPSCGFENPEGLKFCNDCGTPLRIPCVQCGFVNQPQAKFCGECGTPLTAQTSASAAAPPPSPLRYTPGYLAEKLLTSHSALEGERKQVTVLFADLKDSMELLADRDPVASRAIGNDLYMKYSSIGETTHLAGGMEQLATPRSIRLIAETLRLAEGFIQVTPLGAVSVK